MKHRQRAFTLLELLIAVAIFAFIGLAGYRTLNTLIRSDERLAEHHQALRELTRALGVLDRDINQIISRPVRDPYGQWRAALLAGSSDANQNSLELTHQGWRNPLGQPRSTLQRVRWQLSGNQLQRQYWTVLDQAPDSAPLTQQVLSEISALRIRLLDEQGQWRSDWPPTEVSGEQALTRLPQALELTLVSRRFGELRRLYRLADGPTTQVQP